MFCTGFGLMQYMFSHEFGYLPGPDLGSVFFLGLEGPGNPSFLRSSGIEWKTSQSLLITSEMIDRTEQNMSSHGTNPSPYLLDLPSCKHKY